MPTVPKTPPRDLEGQQEPQEIEPKQRAIRMQLIVWGLQALAAVATIVATIYGISTAV
jgi:hypothetical protein